MAAGDLTVPPGHALISLKMTEPTVPHVMVTTLGAKLTTSPPPVSSANQLLSALSNAFKPLFPSSVTFASLHMLVGNDGPPMAADAAGSVTGTRVGVSLAPPQVAWIIQRKTIFSGRQYRGRMYLPFVNENNVNGAGTLDPSDVTLLAAACAALDAIPAGTPAANINSWVILHREPKAGSAPLPTAVSVHLPASKVATQRRRLER
jgi:hypothetical protein